jgi:carbon-monoxide dehydrogenase medium subunit
MKPAPFEYARPDSVQAALALLADRAPDAKVLAGGQSLVPMMNFRMARPGFVVDINRLAELDYHRIEGGELVVGALARHAALMASAVVRAACPLMAEAYRHVGHGPIRTRGTFCGNLCHADPTSEMPAVALATNAVLVLRSVRGERRVPAGEFFRGTYETAAAPDELLVEARVPVAPLGQGWGFHEVSVRKGGSAIAGVAVTISVSAGRIADAAVSVCGAGDRARRLPTVEASLSGAIPDAEALSRAGDAAAMAVDPQEDVNADAAYRRDLVRTLTARALADAVRRTA